MFKRRVTIARAWYLICCCYKFREWLNLDKIIRMQQVRWLCRVRR